MLRFSDAILRGAMVLSAAFFLTAAGCASTKPTSAAPSAGPSAAEVTVTMTVEEARNIVVSIEANWPLSDDHPLKQPASYGDAEKILKLDQVRLFPAGIAYIASQKGVEALAMHGQIELAWGEAYIILVDVMGNLDRLYTSTADALQKKSETQSLTDNETVRLEELRGATAKLRRAGAAFTALIIEHLTAGSEKAEETISEFPDSYLGYRVAADYHRLMEDWPAFDEMIQKVTERNPDSNGMRFLKGAASFRTEKNRAAAADFYRQALQTDPEFVRAQAHLLMVQIEPQALYDEYLKLKELNPDHQVISWAGDGIETTYRDWKAQQGGAPDS